MVNGDGERFSVEKIFIHEKFDLRTYENDIAILKLGKKVSFSAYIKPMCLPPPNLVVNGTVYIAGKQ